MLRGRDTVFLFVEGHSARILRQKKNENAAFCVVDFNYSQYCVEFYSDALYETGWDCFGDSGGVIGSQYDTADCAET